MNLSRTYQKALILYLIYLIAFLSDLTWIQNKLETTETSQEINDTDATLNTSNNQEENEQSSDATPGIAQNELPSLDVYDNTGNGGPDNDSGVIFTASDRTEWLQITRGENSAERRSQQNILRDVFGHIPYVKRNVFSGSPASAWRLLIDNFILKHITKCTITKARCIVQNQNFELTIKKLEIFIAIMYARSVAGKSALTLRDI